MTEVICKRNQRFLQVTVALTVIACFYVACYGVLRWRKVLVRHEASLKADLPSGVAIIAGHDIRRTLTGNVKNAIGEVSVIAFRPLMSLEETIWNRQLDR